MTVLQCIVQAPILLVSFDNFLILFGRQTELKFVIISEHLINAMNDFSFKTSHRNFVF